MPADVIGPSLLAVGQGVTSFTNFLPNFLDVRRASARDNPSFVKDVRTGELAAVVVTVGIGVIASSLTESPVPAYTSIVMSIILVGLYESVLRTEDTNGESA